MASGSAALRSLEPVTVTGGLTVMARESSRPGLAGYDKFFRHYNAGSDSKWQIDLLDKICSLLQMPDNWDGYGAPSPKRDAGMFALEVLRQVMRPRTPMPQVVPSSDGGIQLEWHTCGVDLELHVAAPYRCELWYENHQSGRDPLSCELTNDFSLLQAAVADLTKR